MRHTFGQDPILDRKLFDLLDTVFPGVREGAESIRRFDTSWESVSMPYVRIEDGRIVTHVGVIPLELVVMGTRTHVGSVHAVATHPDCRRRGYYRSTMDEMLADCADRFDTLILSTEQPELYEPFGFRRVQEHCFTVQCDTSGNNEGFRLLDMADPEDTTLLLRLLKSRAPVSQVVGAIKDIAVFCFNESHRPLHYAANIDVLVCMESAEKKLTLYDVVGKHMPPLSALLERMPAPVGEVVIHFAPDCLDVEAQASPYVFEHDGPSYLMVRGPWAAEGQAFTLPRSART